ncbi:MAG TPA: DUF748 domain-containing protein [Ideonella sp.]|uniref:DUF748 domain-containing protein n=1 Tax=Ideonella sp. TaxID=1929293 RepID=UPI002E344385|nr:DUF748 domain-containing protein [Ideonella sp.]HEX5687993.1 DUF748 domain-containing protein [Ideonella sp.]
MPVRRKLVLALIALLLFATVAAAYHVALQRLQGALLQALGPRASVGAIELGWSGLTVRDLHVGAGPGWPAGEELHAGRVRVRPDLASAFGGWRVQRIEIDDARIVLFRGRDGRLNVLPSVLGDARKTPSTPAAAASAAPPTRVLIDHLVLNQVQVDLYDASLPGQRAPHRVQLADLNARLNHLAAPTFDEPMAITLQALLKGPTQDGQLRIEGELTPATREADLKIRLNGADLLALQPYLLKVADGGIKHGLLDLTLDARVHKQQLRAPGQVVLTGLQLASGRGVMDRFAGLSRQAVLAGLERKGRIEMKFTLEGRLDDPSFSVNDSLAKRFATGLAESLGVSVSGVVEGVGEMVKGLFGR